MVDIYFDELRMERIKSDSQNGHVLIFKNTDKDETLSLLANEDELKNIYHKIRRYLESLGVENYELQ